MLRIGLTGQVASGKSEVGRLLRQWGFRVVDTDQMARDVRQRPEIQAAIQQRFGTCDPSALRQRIFHSVQDRADLEALTHPHIRRRMHEVSAEAEASGVPALFVMVPLLFEKNMASLFDHVLCVYAPEAVARGRLQQRDALDEATAQAMISAQLPIDEKCRQAHIIIDNSHDLAHLEASTRQALNQLNLKVT